MKTIEPTKQFLTNTAKTLAEMLDKVQDSIDDEEYEEDDEQRELNERFLKIKEDAKCKEDDTLVTLPFQEVLDLRDKLRNAELKVEDLTSKLEASEEEKEELKTNLRDMKQKQDNTITDLNSKKPTEPTFKAIWSNPQIGCNQCNKKFYNMNVLQTHIRITHRNAAGVVVGEVNTVGDNTMEVNMVGVNTDTDEEPTFRCSECASVHGDSEALNRHMVRKHIVRCEECNTDFVSETKRRNHMSEVHKPEDREQFNCNSCDFQSDKKETLDKHKKTHQPKATSEEFKCRNCEEKFTSFNQLMKHRKLCSPRVCKNGSNCTRGRDCWYVHPDETTDQMEVEDNRPFLNAKFTCHVCNEDFSRKTHLNKHKKEKHADKVQPCREFLQGKCTRSDDNCHFLHRQSAQAQAQGPQVAAPRVESRMDFPSLPQSQHPPDQMMQMLSMMNSLQMTVNGLSQEVMNLRRK